MEIKEATFVISSSKANQCPSPTLPEYAFIGRSNVGKSSLINMICNRKALAKTSSTPGKTQLINHFMINKSWFLVDLPGYGYAKVSKTLRSTFSKLIVDYLNIRENLGVLFVLIDSRLTPQAIDIQFINLIGDAEIPFAIVFTKSDKVSQAELNKNMKAFKDELHKTWEEIPPVFITSSVKTKGKDDLLNYIDDLNKSFVPSITVQTPNN